MFPLELNSPSLKRKLMMSGLGSDLINKITRYIATLKASDGGYIRLAQPIDIGANDDFEITYVFATDAPAYSVLIGNGTTRLFRIEPNGELRAYCGVMNLTSTIIVNDGKLHTATVKRIGNVFSLKVDNENELSVANDGVFSELIFEEITKHGTSYSNVTPLELKSTTLNTLTHHYDFNVAKGTTIIPNWAQPLGSELVTNGTFDHNVDGWNNESITSWFGGRLKLDTVSAYQSSSQMVTVEPNVPYLFTCDVETLGEGHAKGYIQLRDVEASEIVYQQIGTAKNKVLVVCKGTKLGIILHGNEQAGVTYFDNISVRKAPYWAEYINVTDDNKERYEWDAGRNAWVGVQNLYTATPILDGGVALYDALQTGTNLRIEPNTNYLVKMDALNFVGEAALRIGDVPSAAIRLSTGETSTDWLEVNSLNNNTRFYLQERSSTGTTADSITVQVYKILEVAQ